MKSVAIWCLAIGASLVVWSDASAQEAKGKKNANPGQNSPVFNLPKDVELSPEQQEKLLALKKEYGPKVAELQKKIDGILSEEQIQARKDVTAKLKSENNLKGKARQDEINAALKLTDEQKAKWEAAQKDQRALQAEIRGKIAAFLTDEQKAKVPNLTPKAPKKAK